MYWFTGTDWDGTDLDGNVLPSGTQCVYSITAYGDGDYPTVYDEELGRYVTDVESIVPGVNEPTFNGHAFDMTGNVIAFDVMVDTEAPKLVNNAVTIYEEDGHTYLKGTFTDEGSIASIQVAPVVTRTYKEGYGDPSYAESRVTLSDSFYTEYIYDKDIDRYTFIADVTEYVHNDTYAGESNYYNFTWTGDVYIYGGDYGGNDRAYAVRVEDNTKEGLLLSQTSALLHVGNSFDLSVIDNTGMDAPITRTSSAPEVATIDEYGHVEALSVGQTTITVTNGTYTAICIVAVEEYPTEVVDFNLSIASFSGMKPGGELIVKVVDLYPADVVLNEIRWEVSEDEGTAEYYEGLITCARYTTDGLQGEIYLNYSAYDEYDQGNAPIPGGSATLTVMLNGVSRQMHIDWEDLYKTKSDEDIVFDAYAGEQTVYVKQGETATLTAKYNNSSAHSVLPVKLYSLEGAQNYSYTNPTEEATGLVLDGPGYVSVGGEWRGRLVNTEGYALPETIQIGYSYPDSSGGNYEYWWSNSPYYSYYTYDSTTGEIYVKYGPSGANNTMVIRADGVESAGNPAGTLSGTVYETPDALYGPFDWTANEGYELSGELTIEENVTVGYTTKNVAHYTPSEPGVSYITATSKDGKYSVNFAVVCEPIKAETLSLSANNLEMEVGDEEALEAALAPEPSLEKDKEILWTSFNEDVATVDENGVVTAVGVGYAYLKAVTKADTTVTSYCIVRVTAGSYTVTLAPGNGEEEIEITVTYGEPSVTPEPTEPDVPKTSDSMNVALCIVLLLAAAAVLGTAAIWKRRQWRA